jgi:hypothetical protein
VAAPGPLPLGLGHRQAHRNQQPGHAGQQQAHHRDARETEHQQQQQRDRRHRRREIRQAADLAQQQLAQLMRTTARRSPGRLSAPEARHRGRGRAARKKPGCPQLAGITQRAAVHESLLEGLILHIEHAANRCA